MCKNFLEKCKTIYSQVIKNDTTLVIIIALLIVLVGILISQGNMNYKSNVLEFNSYNSNNTFQAISGATINIDNKQYSLTLKEIK